MEERNDMKEGSMRNRNEDLGLYMVFIQVGIIKHFQISKLENSKIQNSKHLKFRKCAFIL